MWLSCKKHREFHLMKILNVHKKKSILKAAGEKDQVPIRETLDSSMESLGMERTGRMVYRFWQNTNDRLYFTKLSLIIEEKILSMIKGLSNFISQNQIYWSYWKETGKTRGRCQEGYCKEFHWTFKWQYSLIYPMKWKSKKHFQIVWSQYCKFWKRFKKLSYWPNSVMNIEVQIHNKIIAS